jgi:hypothetical protein
MIDASKIVEAHLLAQGIAPARKLDGQQASVEPNPDRTYTSQQRVRVYVATPRGNT